MALTTAQQTDAYRFFAIAFGAAPGVEFMNQIALAYEGGANTKQVVNEFVKKSQFTNTYPIFLTNAQFADRLIENVVGTSATAAAKTEAKADVVSALTGGATRGDVIFQVFSNLAALTGDAKWGNVATKLANQVEVARYYTETLLRSSTDLATLQAVLTGVNESTNVTAAALEARLNPVVPVAGQTFTLTTGVDTTLVGGAGNDTYNGSGTTLTSGDQLDGGAGTDTLQITTTAAANVGTGVTSKGVEAVNVTATVGTATVDATNFADVTSVGSNGSTADVVINNLRAIPTVNVTATSNNLTVGVAATAVAGTADSATINLNGAATGAGNTISINGIETLNIATNGTASGSTTSAVTIDAAASPGLTTVNLSGSAAGRVAVTLGGATATVTGTVTSGDAAHDVTVTADGTDKISVSMGAGNDTVRLTGAPGLAANSTTVGSWTVAGGDGTDTLVTGSNITSATGSNISGFESVSITGGASVTLSASTNTISSVTFDASGGTLAGLAAGATVTQAAGGSATVTNTTGWTGTADNLAVTVGTATTATAITQSLSAAGIETATITNLALSTDLASARSVGVSGANLRTLTVTGTQPTTITGGGAATTTVDASGVSGNVTLNAGTGGTFTVAAAGASITSAAGNDTITGGAGADSITSGAGNDNITAGAGADVVTAGDGNDTIDLGTGNDSVDAGAGNDTITAGLGADTMTGGTGADTFIIAANTALDSSSTAAATDVITDFVSGTDKIQLGQTVSSFVGNFATLQLGLANTTGDNQAFFVTGENQLYVIATKAAGYVTTDTVVKLNGVTAVTKEDLGIGSQGAGNTVTIAGGAGTVSTTANTATIVSARTTALDDTINLTVASAVAGTYADQSDITGGAGRDTVNITTTAAGLTKLNTAAAATNVKLSGVEVVNISVSDTLGGVVSLTNQIPTDVESITVTGANAGLTATFTAANQTFNTTANTTLGGNASTIDFANLKGLSASTGSANDVFNLVQADFTTISGGAGNDTVNVSAMAALGTSSRLDGGTQSAGGVDTLALPALGASENVDLADLASKSIIAGFERVTFANADDSTHAITLATGITQIATATSNAAEKFNITGTAAQIGALTSVVDGGVTGETNLIISDAGSVSFAGDTLTAVDLISWQSAAVALTLSNDALVVSQGATTAGTAAQSVTFGDGSAAQTATLRTTGTATFNMTAATVRAMTTGGADKADMTIASAPGATTTLNITGAGGTAIDLTDADLVLTNANLDTISLGGVTSAQTFVFGAGTATTLLQSNTAGVLAGPVVNITESGTSQVAYTLNTDTGGASTHVLNVIGFDAGAGGDVLDLGGVGNTNGGGAATLSVNAGIAIAGASVAMTAAAAAGGPATLYVLTGSTMRVNGSLAATGDAGVVEAAIINAALRATGSGGGAWVAGDEFYVVLDNGTDSGVYRVATAGTPAGGEVIDTAAEFSVTLVAILQGVLTPALVGPNFG